MEKETPSAQYDGFIFLTRKLLIDVSYNIQSVGVREVINVILVTLCITITRLY